jgi:hypothetical protein
MPVFEDDIARIQEMLSDLRAIRARTCRPEDRDGLRRRTLAEAEQALRRAVASMRDEPDHDQRTARSRPSDRSQGATRRSTPRRPAG